MSKAFTKEDGAVPEPAVSRPVPTVRPGEVRYITREGYASLLAERAELQDKRRTQGFSLDAALQQANLTARLSYLEQVLNLVTPFDQPPGDPRQAAFGAWVTVALEDRSEATYRLVGPDEADARKGLLSVEAPLARQLLGKQEGETFTLQRPGGEVECTVQRVRWR